MFIVENMLVPFLCHQTPCLFYHIVHINMRERTKYWTPCLFYHIVHINMRESTKYWTPCLFYHIVHINMRESTKYQIRNSILLYRVYRVVYIQGRVGGKANENFHNKIFFPISQIFSLYFALFCEISHFFAKMNFEKLNSNFSEKANMFAIFFANLPFSLT